MSSRTDFYVAAEHEECWSRLMYVVEHQRRLGLLTGAAEVGKSTLLRSVGDHASRFVHCKVEHIDASGLTHEELADKLAEACGGREDSPWDAFEDWLWGAAAGSTSSLWIIDHVDQALDELVPAVRRLVRMIAQTRAPASVIAAARNWNSVSAVSDLADIWSDLPSWDLLTTDAYLDRQMQSSEPDTRLTSAAVQGIYDCTQGVAGRVQRLYEMCQLAAQLRETSTIDVDLVVEVWGELLSPLSHARHEAVVQTS